MIKIKISFLIFGLIMSISLFAQDSQIDPKFNDLYGKNKKDFFKLYDENMKVKDYKKALKYARLAFARSEDMREESIALLDIAAVYVSLGDLKKAKLVYRQIIRNYPTQEIQVKAAKEKLLKL